jgi:hypothetical protein
MMETTQKLSVAMIKWLIGTADVALPPVLYAPIGSVSMKL